MNSELVACDEIYQGANFQLYWFVHFAARWRQIVFIINLDNELQTCSL